jgi:hypothetical protein
LGFDITVEAVRFVLSHRRALSPPTPVPIGGG